jgi:hypothetical protein
VLLFDPLFPLVSQTDLAHTLMANAKPLRNACVSFAPFGGITDSRVSLNESFCVFQHFVLNSV